jgi:DMSO/TMAO reductase YedYZ heme-binding membrane subunit
MLMDSYAHVGWVGALVPFQSGYRPWQVSLGLVSLYLLVLVSVTGILRSRLASSERASRWWRRIHLSSYAAWAMSAGHFLVAGTDSGTWWALAVLFAGIAVVATGAIARLSDRPALVGRPQAPVARFAAATPPRLPVGARR